MKSMNGVTINFNVQMPSPLFCCKKVFYWIYLFLKVQCYCFDLVFCAPEPKAQVLYCDHASSVRRLSSLIVHIFHFSSKTAEWNLTKLDRKQDRNVLYQVCVFRAYRKNKMAALASDWLRHFRLLLWNRSAEFNETWQEARPQSPLPSLCFSGRSEKQDGRPGLWLAETFSTSLKPLNRRWTKLDMMQDLNILYQVCVFQADRKKQNGRPGLWLKHFQLLWNRWTEFNETWQKARSQRSSMTIHLYIVIVVLDSRYD